MSQNVVTYATVIDVENAEFKLKPGMTATVTIEVARRKDALAVPAAALRFKPTAAMLAALGQASGGDAGTCAGVSNCGTLWCYDGAAIRGVAVRTGITNGMAVEILGSPVEAGTTAVSAITLPASTSKTVPSVSSSSTARSPLLGGSPPPPPSGGMGGPR